MNPYFERTLKMLHKNKKISDKNQEKKYDAKAKKRFWKKVEKVGNCYFWTASQQTGRYGQFNYRGKIMLAHHFSFEMATGDKLAPGEKLLHSCDHPLCVNPKHVRKGTSADNSKDMVEKGRSAYGDKHGLAKLTWLEVDDMRSKYESNKYRISDLARLFHISQSQVSLIVHNKVWKKHNKDKPNPPE
jgi:hypothetical protein